MSSSPSRSSSKGEDDEIEKHSMLREYTVFNIAQIDGFTVVEKPLPPEPQPHAAVEAFIVATHADIRHGGDKACFVPAHDFINLPPASSFKSIEPFYAVALHELGHNAAIRIMPRAVEKARLAA